jgi:hypothetical protein
MIVWTSFDYVDSRRFSGRARDGATGTRAHQSGDWPPATRSGAF